MTSESIASRLALAMAVRMRLLIRMNCWRWSGDIEDMNVQSIYGQSQEYSEAAAKLFAAQTQIDAMSENRDRAARQIQQGQH